ncbi:MAG: tRNA (guanosine(37)-N1)-methyltransferase TrmD [SAR324 cluster bacterium]|nr:tRNA (guanosine(37)-N1)-methyltransferase TrmD [SAR324 cluster bacterium]
MMQFEILTLFPEIFSSFLGESLIKRALDEKHIHVNLYNFRQHGTGKHLRVDDAPYGGGPGMVLQVEPIYQALKARELHYRAQNQKIHRILLSPQGEPFKQKKAKELSQSDEVLLFICGRYEGFDERIRLYVDEEISGGDFVCLGGEVIAMMMIETISRLIPGVLGNQESSEVESFAQGMLEYPQYTRPSVFKNAKIPEILVSGNHQQIEFWRRDEAEKRTNKRRPDLNKNY